MKKSKIIVLALMCLMLAGTILFTNDKLFKADVTEDTIIVDGVYIGGIDVSGMTAKQATDAVNAYIDELKAETVTLKGLESELVLTYGDMGLTAKVDEAVAKAITIAQYGNLIQRFMNLKDLENENLVIPMGLSIDKQLLGQTLYDKSKELNIEVIDNTIVRKNGKFEYVAGKKGSEIDIVTSVNAISEVVTTQCESAIPQESTFLLVYNDIEPKGTQEELAKVQDELGRFGTFYGNSDEGRKKNVENGCEKLNGTILYPGEEVSVYAVTSPYTLANGYKEAGSYDNGNVVKSIGGGICQVSTTLYNAALFAEVEITLRSPHSMTVGYVDISGDAAIAGTYKDLRFKNNYDAPIYIEGECYDGWLTFTIYGEDTRPANREISFETEIVSENEPETEYTLSKDHKVGTYEVVRSKFIGYSAKYWKIVKVDGVEKERIQVNKSNYQASCMKVTIGTAGATAEELAEINKALATKDDDKIKLVVEGMAEPVKQEGTDKTPATPGNGTGNGTNTGDNANTGNNANAEDNTNTGTDTNTGDSTNTGNNSNTGNEESQTPDNNTDEESNPVDENQN